MPAWLRRIGFVLSTSDDESFHVAPAEGMASGAVPVIRHWPGAETIYDTRWIRETPAEMAASIAALASPDDWEAAGRTRTSRCRRSSSARSAAAGTGCSPRSLAPGAGPAYAACRVPRLAG